MILHLVIQQTERSFVCAQFIDLRLATEAQASSHKPVTLVPATMENRVETYRWFDKPFWMQFMMQMHQLSEHEAWERWPVMLRDCPKRKKQPDTGEWEIMVMISISP